MPVTRATMEAAHAHLRKRSPSLDEHLKLKDNSVINYDDGEQRDARLIERLVKLDLRERLPKYNGRHNSDLERWLADYYRISTSAGWSDRQKIDGLTTYLIESAEDWWLSLTNEEKPKTWYEVQAQMRREFLLEDYQRMKLRELRNKKQTSNEPVAEYIRSVIRLCRTVDANMDEGVKIDFILDGLLPELHNRVNHKYYLQLEELKLDLRVAEQRLEKTKPMTDTRSGSKRYLAVNAIDTPAYESRQPRKEFTSQQPKPRKQITCFLCEEIGHYRANCPLLPKLEQWKQSEKQSSQTLHVNSISVEPEIERLSKIEPLITYENQRRLVVEVELKLDGKPMVAMIDTGSDLSIIDEEEALRLGLQIDNSANIQMGAANKLPFRSVGKAYCQMQVAKVKRMMEMAVVPHFICPLLIGKEWLFALKPTFNFAQLKVTFFDKGISSSTSIRAMPIEDDRTSYEVMAMQYFNQLDEEIPTVPSTNRTPEYTVGELETNDQCRANGLLQRYNHLFATMAINTTTTGVEHTIPIGDAQPIHCAPYRTSIKEREEIRAQLDVMLENAVIQPSASPWAAPVILEDKKDGTKRFCVDFRKLNAVTTRDSYPMPRIDDMLDLLGQSLYFSTMDLTNGYWQVPIAKQDVQKTAFITPFGLFEFLVMPFGLANAPATFQRLMDSVLAGLKWHECLVYLDDIIVFGATFEQHLERLERVFERLDKVGLRLKAKKSVFFTSSIEYLGHHITRDGIQPSETKVKALMKMPPPTDLTQLRSFVGLCSYFRKFIKGYTEKAKPLTDLTKKNCVFSWDEMQQTAFVELKNALAEAPMLAHPDFMLEFELHTDASSYGIGASLVQHQKGTETPISFFSRTLTPCETRYSVTERECLAIVRAVRAFRPYLHGRKFTVVTDHHALCWLLSLKEPHGRLGRWSLQLMEYEMCIKYKSGRLHQDADAFSRLPIIATICYTSASSELFSRQNTLWEESMNEDPWTRTLQSTLNKDPNDRTRIEKKKTKLFTLEDGRIYYKTLRRGEEASLLAVPKGCRKAILQSFHDDKTSGHLGYQRTLSAIRMRFYWPTLARDVKKFVRGCIACQKKKTPRTAPVGLAQPLSVTGPFHRIGIDFVGPLPATRNGNKYILTCVEYLTRWAIAWAVPSASTVCAGHFLAEAVVSLHGVPLTLISDRGSHFTSGAFQELLRRLGIKHARTTAYHPQSNGLTERFNGTLAQMLTHFVDTEQENWDEVLPYVIFAYNCSRHSVTGYSPFKMLYGRDPVLPGDIEFTAVARHSSFNPSYLVALESRLAGMCAEVLKKTEEAQEKAANAYNKGRRTVLYDIGSEVWICVPAGKKGKATKLLYNWQGPVKVVRKISDLCYEVKREDEDETMLVNIKFMKPAFCQEEPEQQSVGIVAYDATVADEDELNGSDTGENAHVGDGEDAHPLVGGSDTIIEDPAHLIERVCVTRDEIADPCPLEA